jgi:hypothetical protein
VQNITDSDDKNINPQTYAEKYIREQRSENEEYTAEVKHVHYRPKNAP